MMSSPAPARRGAHNTRETESINGGVLIWEDDADKAGRRLVGFSAVKDWDAVRSELIRRGIGVGAIHQLEEFEFQEIAGQ